jgi:hypothetical protein
MEQLKAERGKEEVVQRLYDWELSKKARIEEAQDAAAPPFTPQLYASTRRSEYDHAELDEADAGPGLVDRCFEWSHNREEWLKVCRSDSASLPHTHTTTTTTTTANLTLTRTNACTHARAHTTYSSVSIVSITHLVHKVTKSRFDLLSWTRRSKMSSCVTSSGTTNVPQKKTSMVLVVRRFRRQSVTSEKQKRGEI